MTVPVCRYDAVVVGKAERFAVLFEDEHQGGNVFPAADETSAVRKQEEVEKATGQVGKDILDGGSVDHSGGRADGFLDFPDDLTTGGTRPCMAGIFLRQQLSSVLFGLAGIQAFDSKHSYHSLLFI